ncbi:MAG: PspC domain-containing protein [Jatrophihabitans sp.]
MTTTDMPYAATPPPTAPPRVLRRSRNGRVGAGVAGGLGSYFGVDPVLFRVLFATSAFFGGAGILAYLLAWAAIPEEGTEHAPIDGWVTGLRRRRVPLWVAIVIGSIVLWAAAFSWWLPGPFFPAVAIAVLLIAVYGRRQWQAEGTAPVDLTKAADPGSTDSTTAPHQRPAWADEARAWAQESRAAARVHRRRARPVALSTVAVLAATLVTLGLVDSVANIPVVVYFWTTLGIVTLGLLVGAVSRRFPFSVLWLVVPALVGVLALGGSHASFHDGIGQRTWTPTTTPAANYRLAFGQGTLDLRSLPALDTARTVRITAAAGRIRVLIPKTANVTVEANVHIGEVDVDGERASDGDGGVGISRTVRAPGNAVGAPLLVSIHLADGRIDVERV